MWMWAFGVLDKEGKYLKFSCISVLIQKFFPLQSRGDSLLICPGAYSSYPPCPPNFNHSQLLPDLTTSYLRVSSFHSLIERLEGFLDYHRVVLIKVWSCEMRLSAMIQPPPFYIKTLESRRPDGSYGSILKLLIQRSRIFVNWVDY